MNDFGGGSGEVLFVGERCVGKWGRGEWCCGRWAWGGVAGERLCMRLDRICHAGCATMSVVRRKFVSVGGGSLGGVDVGMAFVLLSECWLSADVLDGHTYR